MDQAFMGKTGVYVVVAIVYTLFNAHQTNIDPDNYTDPPTFLSHYQRPRPLPYDFWPLVADSTVIVQHISSVAIFVFCFVGIIQERISPVSVVSCGSVGTILGWVLWDFWVGQQEAAKVPIETLPIGNGDIMSADAGSGASSSLSINLMNSTSPSKELQDQGLGLTLTTSNLSPGHSHSQSQTSILSASSGRSPTLSIQSSTTPNFQTHNIPPTYEFPSCKVSLRNQQRLATVKSATLIYCALLGLSPILKSLTKSTTSDSIWAMSFWLMCINVFFFDYGGGVGVKYNPYLSMIFLNRSLVLCAKIAPNFHYRFPASLSTNAALMASTVLASRLPSTTHVFSLTLFSIEVFGLFPVFRRHLRHISWRGHLMLTLALVVGAGAGLGITLAGKGQGGWRAAVGGVILWGVGTAVGMGGCSWLLIGLQKYKHVMIGPWDPARPVIKQGGGWE
ncbi:hypothetical protein MMC07_000701 [Pseudocyphellaria aurata]|nr:hypothetical protein [Pseudocyphellaria aurata]